MCFNEPPTGGGEVQLVDGTKQHMGIVQVKYMGMWGHICDDGWDDNAAQVRAVLPLYIWVDNIFTDDIEEISCYFPH